MGGPTGGPMGGLTMGGPMGGPMAGPMGCSMGSPMENPLELSPSGAKGSMFPGAWCWVTTTPRQAAKQMASHYKEIPRGKKSKRFVRLLGPINCSCLRSH